MLIWLQNHASELVFFIVLIELLIAVFLDFKTAKFPNKFFIIYAILNVLLLVLLRGPSGLVVGALTLLVAVMLSFPVYFIRILGGGDLKLIFSLAPLLLLDEFVGFFFMCFVWAGLFGLVKNTTNGSLKKLIKNTALVTQKLAVPEAGIPFTVGILLAWCSYKSVLALGFW